jgi:hypothetical protein
MSAIRRKRTVMIDLGSTSAASPYILQVSRELRVISCFEMLTTMLQLAFCLKPLFLGYCAAVARQFRSQKARQVLMTTSFSAFRCFIKFIGYRLDVGLYQRRISYTACLDCPTDAQCLLTCCASRSASALHQHGADFNSMILETK